MRLADAAARVRETGRFHFGPAEHYCSKKLARSDGISFNSCLSPEANVSAVRYLGRT